MAYTTIDDPSAYFQTLLYTGNATGRSLDNTGNSDLKPDWIWVKKRANDAQNHTATDSTRGVANILFQDGTDAESATQLVTEFRTNGFGINTNALINDNTDTYVAWQWKANGGTRTTNAESGNNPAGGYQANTTAGFSIVDYVGTGALGTMAHGLGIKPEWIVIKNRGSGGWSWYTYHGSNTDAPETELLYMNNDDATTDTAAIWNDTAPTSSVFTINTNGGVNADANNYIAYCFAPIQGYSRFGSYIGNQDADGPFVYTGFKPAWLFVKNTTSDGNSWVMLDNKRQGFNPENDFLFSNSNAVESVDLSNHGFDFLSNGFKQRGTGQNDDGDLFVYMAFAESPFVTSTGIPTTAR
jgi:hypothetical protein